MAASKIAKVAGGFSLLTLAAPALADDGEKVFAQCSACHSLDASKAGGIGPNLAHVVGRKAGSVQGYHYSPAMSGSGVVWTKRSLDAFLANPKAVVKGTKMPFSGIADANARAALIAFLAKH